MTTETRPAYAPKSPYRVWSGCAVYACDTHGGFFISDSPNCRTLQQHYTTLGAAVREIEPGSGLGSSPTPRHRRG